MDQQGLLNRQDVDYVSKIKRLMVVEAFFFEGSEFQTMKNRATLWLHVLFSL